MPTSRSTHDDLRAWVGRLVLGPHANLGSTPRYRVVERAALGEAMRLGLALSAVLFALGGLSAFVFVPAAAPQILGINLGFAAICLVTRLLAVGPLRRHVLELAVAWTVVVCLGLIGATFITTREIYLATLLLFCMGLMLAAFLPLTTPAQLIGSFSALAATLIIAAIHLTGSPDLLSAVMMMSLIAAVISIAAHLLVRRSRLESHARYLQIRELNMAAGAQSRVLERANESLARVARRDSLTGLGNRLDLNEELARADGEVQRGTTVGVVVIDIDRFKLYNDSRGHLAGDSVLRTVGGALLESIRANDAAFRFGGEEFVVLTRDLDLDDVELIGRRILERIERLAIPHVENAPWGVITASAGVAIARVTVADALTDALGRADEALFEAKRSGRNRLIVAGAAPGVAASGAAGVGASGAVSERREIPAAS